VNLLAATCLLIHGTEEDSFWQLVSIIDNLLPQNYFAPDLSDTRIDQIILKHYVASLCPSLHLHFTKLHVDIEAITFNWFLTIFTDSLPPEVRTCNFLSTSILIVVALDIIQGLGRILHRRERDLVSHCNCIIKTT
jgi:hypothetical protein